MASFRRELPSEGLIKVDVELWRGDLTVRSARPGEAAVLESDWEVDVTSDGRTLRARQPLGIKRPFDLADLVGEQQVRIEVEGVVLFDKQIRHGGGDVLIVLPASVRELRLRTARGDIHLEGVEVAAEAYTGGGNVRLSDGVGRTAAGTAAGDINVSGWRGHLHVRTGKGNLEVRSVHGDLDARTGKGEISIQGAKSRVDAHTDHGNLVASRLSGHASLSTGHGDLVATDLEGARLEGFTGHGEITLRGRIAGAKVKTGHGDIVCRLTAAEGDHELHTERGNIILDLYGGVAARIDASTRHGGIDSNLPLVRVGTSGPAGVFSQRLVGTTAGSDPIASIQLNTRGGDIRVFRREGVTTSVTTAANGDASVQKGEGSNRLDSMPAESPIAPGVPANPQPWTAPVLLAEETTANTQPDRDGNLELEVLRALSRGDLSVDETLLLLEKIREDGDVTREKVVS